MASSVCKPPPPIPPPQISIHPMAVTTSGGSVLPTHTTPSAPAYPASTKPTTTSQNPRRRRCLCLCLCLLLTLALLAITLLVLFLTVLKVRDPTTRLVSTRLSGLSPRLTFPAVSLQLNVTLLLVVAVHNPNPASFAYDAGGHTDVAYRGARVGEAQIDPGAIPSRGDANVSLALTLQADRFAQHLPQLLADVEAGAVPLDASTRIPGRVNVFGVFRRRAVAYSDCSFVFGVPEMRVRTQLCRDRTKL